MPEQHHRPPIAELRTFRQFAEQINRSQGAVRDWVAAGLVTVYELPGMRGARIWPAEAEQEIRAAVAAGKIRPSYGSYGKRARVVTLPAAGR